MWLVFEPQSTCTSVDGRLAQSAAWSTPTRRGESGLVGMWSGKLDFQHVRLRYLDPDSELEEPLVRF